MQIVLTIRSGQPTVTTNRLSSRSDRTRVDSNWHRRVNDL